MEQNANTQISAPEEVLVIKEGSVPVDKNIIKTSVARTPLDPNPYQTHIMQTKSKSNYKVEKNLKNLKKSLAYKESYKEKEQNVKYNRSNDSGHHYSPNNTNNTNDINMDKLELCDDLILILKDKIKNKQIQITLFEEKTINKFFDTFDKSKILYRDQPQKEYRERTIELQQCFTGDKCIVWYCRFEHSDNRKKECKCTEVECDKLHAHQALCKNVNHASDCKLAHRIQDIK